MGIQTRTNIGKEHIIVIGGGFAGLNFIKSIDKEKFNVTLIDRNNFHSFPPLFYQVASSGLDPASIAFPFRREMRKRHVKGVNFHMGNVSEIDFERKTVTTNLEILSYDRLVIAAGTTNNFFGNPGLRDKVYTLKSTSEALRIRNDALDCLERASVCTDEAMRCRLLSFVVIGGGPAGVEIAGALGEMKRYAIKRDYPSLRPEDVKIILLEGQDRVLAAMSKVSSQRALEDLESLMVDVRLGVLMKDYVDNRVILSDNTEIEAAMVIWTAGITAEPFVMKGADLKLGPGNRFVTDCYNCVEGVENVYAIGDIGFTASKSYPKGFPQLAQVAIQQARHLAKGLNAGEFSDSFEYIDKGTMATIGRKKAVADLKHFHLTGVIAWLAWMFIHLVSILGMRNKITVVINWMWAYFTYNTALRLLIHTNRYPLRCRWRDEQSIKV